MKVLIVEDEKFAAQRLVSLLEQQPEHLEVVAILDTVASSVEYINENPLPDLVFMDIQLGDGKSFEIFKKTKIKCPVIFTTAFDEYAIQAFKYNSIDYLLKPLKKEELHFAINKYKRQAVQVAITPDISEMLEFFKEQKKEYRTRFLVRSGTRLFSFRANEIAFFYTKERLHYIKTFNGEDFILENNLDELETQLDPSLFFRVNRQFIVNYQCIDKVYAWFDGKIKLSVNPVSYEDIVISRLKANDFKCWLGR